jgi:hypothetical protein
MTPLMSRGTVLVLWLSEAAATAEIAIARSNEHDTTILFIPVSLQFHGTTISPRLVHENQGLVRPRGSPVDEQATGDTGAGEGVRMRHGS